MMSGIVAEFDSPEALTRAYERLGRQGFTRLWSWTPYPVRAVVERRPPSPVGWIMLAFGIAGGVLAYALQWWCNAVDYPLDVGGRPLQSVPAFIPITFETVVLFSGVSGFFATLFLSGLPRLSHPIFQVTGFERASIDRFFLGVDAVDPQFDERVAGELEELGALRCERLGALR